MMTARQRRRIKQMWSEHRVPLAVPSVDQPPMLPLASAPTLGYVYRNDMDYWNLRLASMRKSHG